MDPLHHKEFCFSSDGAYVAVGSWRLGSKDKPEVCVIRVSDGQVFPLENVSYDFGGGRLCIDPEPRRLFAASCLRTAISAYDDFDSSCEVWRRRDLKGAGHIAYDPFDDSLYCWIGKRTVVLDATRGTERAIYRNLTEFFFARESKYAVFNSTKVELKNRTAGTSIDIPSQSENVLWVAFTASAIVISWVAGPVTSHELATGRHLWTYRPEGDHAYRGGVCSDNESVWVVEQSYKKENDRPGQRIRLLENSGNVSHETWAALGHSFEIAPYMDKVIRMDASIHDLKSL